MRSTSLPLFVALLAACSAACSGTGQPEVAYEAFATPIAPSTITAGDWTVTLDEAIVAFGPLYLCAAQSGSATLCDTAIGEVTHTTAIDALDPTPQPLGTVHGLAGTIRSASYDYGIHWFLTEESPTAAREAPGGHSARLAGSAEKGGVVVHFTADVDVVAQFRGQRAVPSTPASAEIDGSGERLDVGMDVGAWLSHVDFDLAGGEDPYVIAPGSRNHGALVIAMTAEEPPALTWSKAP